MQARHDDSSGMGLNSPSLQDQASASSNIPQTPAVSDDKIGRNEKIRVLSPSGKEIEVKFKKLQHYINQGYTKV